MRYIKVDIRISENPKILCVPRAYRWAYIELLCYCARNLTDGFIPAGYTDVVCQPEEIEALASFCLIVASPGGWLIRDYLDWQTDSATVEKRREAGRAGGIKSGESRRNAKQNAKQNPDEAPSAKHETKQNEAHAKQVLHVAREPEIEIEREIEELQRLSAATPQTSEPAKPDPDEHPDDDIRQLAQLLADQLDTLGVKHGYPRRSAKTWHRDLRRMRDLDNRTPTEIAGAIRWALANPFWKAHIHSPKKLRDKFDTLRLQAGNPHTNTHQANQDLVRRLAAREAAESHAS